MSTKTLATVVIAGLVLLGFVAGATAMDMTVKIGPENNSGESGTATLSAAGDSTKVVISITGGPATAQPTHIHKGTCDKLDPKPAFPLSPVVNGKSETTVKVAMKDLEKGYAINGHKSAQDLKTYVFCGNIGGGM